MNIKKDPENKILRLIRNWAVPIGCGLVFLFLLKFVFFIGYVPSTSMEPTIKAGSLIFGTRVLGDLKRGDVIAFEHEGLILVKRIAGIPGDVVYAGNRTMVVPTGCYYVLGDNTAASIDSRYWDEPFVPLTDVIATISALRDA
ncbi:MAG: signal peptidase I [Firmicutes bacterium]|nr:signal peptidase I [Bacillota bacterium]